MRLFDLFKVPRLKLPGWPARKQLAEPAKTGPKPRVGMSQKSIKTAITGKPANAPNNGKRPEIVEESINPIGIYLDLIKGDVKRVFRIDEASRMKQNEYEDFMEQHFGKGKRL